MRSRRRSLVTLLSVNGPDEPQVPDGEPAPIGPPAAMSSRTKQETKPRAKRSPKQTPASRPSGDGDDGFLARLRRSLVRPRFILLVVGGIAAAVFLPGVWRSLPDPGERREYRLRTDRMEIAPPPRDVPPDIVRQVIRRANLPADVSLLDDDLTRRIAEAFSAHPWVAEVVSVQKSFPPRISVELKYRVPVAMVEVSGGMYPVDANAVLLPPEDFSLADTRRYPVIRGIASRPAGPAGARWGDPVVSAAGKLAEKLKPVWRDLQLSAIRPFKSPSPADAGDDPQFELTTRGGSRILWGRAPGSDHPGELTAEQKIGRLKKYAADFGGFDRPHGPYEIDIRHWQEITRRPISLRPTPTSRR